MKKKIFFIVALSIAVFSFLMVSIKEDKVSIIKANIVDFNSISIQRGF